MNEIAKRIISELVKRDGRDTFKIAFLPYKYSMWDSMKSVYEEAKAAGLKARVYPVPYFTKPDGKMHDEHKYYSEFDCYDMEVFNPDYVVIHNPYDNHNKITEIYPQYQSFKLKEMGYKLVYSPYSCMMKAPHFVMHTGVINSDYIIVEDDDVAKMYRDTWLKKNNIDIFERLIIAGGHPKQDTAKRVPEQIIVPGKWIEYGVFSKPVVSIFGGLISVINAPCERLNTYKDIIFKEVLNGNCVVFRPHPLTADGYRAMIPDVAFLWDSFIDEIKPQCIIDDTPDLYRAIHICTRAYADAGSVQDLLGWAHKEYTAIE